MSVFNSAWLCCGSLISGLTVEISSLPGTCFYGSRPKQQVKMNCENFFKTYVMFVHIHHLKRTGKYVPPEGGTRSQGNRQWRGKEREWIHLFKVFFLSFLMWIILNLLQYCFCFMFWVFFFWPWGMWYFISPTRDQTCTPCFRRWSLNHWTAREIPSFNIVGVV